MHIGHYVELAGLEKTHAFIHDPRIDERAVRADANESASTDLGCGPQQPSEYVVQVSAVTNQFVFRTKMRDCIVGVFC